MRKLILAAIGLLGILGFVFLLMWPKEEMETADKAAPSEAQENVIARSEAPAVAPAPPVEDKTPKLNVIAGTPLKNLVAKENKKNPSSCLPEQKILVRGSISQFVDQLKTKKLVLNPTCWLPLAGLGVDPCLKIADPKTQSWAPAGCRRYLISARARLVDDFSAGQTDYKTMELPVLVAKIMNVIAQLPTEEGLSASKRSDWKMMTEALAERQPDSLEAKKAQIMSYIHLLPAEKLKAEKDLPAIALKALQLAPRDPDVNELYLFLLGQDPKTTEQIFSYADSHSDIPVAQYYAAWEYWKKKDLKSAEAKLRTASQLQPINRRFSQALRSLETVIASGGKQEIQLFRQQLFFSFDQF